MLTYANPGPRGCTARALAMLLILAAPPCFAHPEDTIEEVVVYGRADTQIGTSTAASSGRVSHGDLNVPMLRVGELVEVIPGMVATQHSGTGKANQYFLRGFNLDHGTDFYASAGGVPVNMRTHGHGQGYLDLNFLIPEVVETISFRKGPYHASIGDFSSAASVDFQFVDRLKAPLLKATVGEDGFGDFLLAGSVGDDQASFTAAVDAMRYEGPWALDEDLRARKAYVSQVWQPEELKVAATFQHYDSDWNSTDQIPQRAVTGGLIDELGFIDPHLGGETRRDVFSLGVDSPAWQAGLYAIDYEFNLFSNFTYFLDDPLDGDEFEQADKRRVYGGHVHGSINLESASPLTQVRWGLSARYDDIEDVGLYRTSARRRLATVREDSVTTWSVDGFVEAEAYITDALRIIGGVRVDQLHWDVTAQRPANSGTGQDTIFSPKLTVAYRPAERLELFANWGRGFHSNDVRGATLSIDPATGEAADSVDALVASNGYELGARFEWERAFNLSLVAFRLDLDSELLFVGDAGTTEANGATTRRGLELATFWQANDWLALNAAWTWTDPQFEDAANGREIPGAVETTATFGVNIAASGGLGFSLRARYLGEAPLVEDGSIEADSSLLVNAAVYRRFGNLDLRLDVFNLTDSDDADISYFFASRLPGEPAEGIEDRHFHPLEPRTIRGTVTLFF